MSVSLCISVCLSVCLCIFFISLSPMSICLSSEIFIYLSDFLYFCPATSLSVFLSICLPIRLCLSLCLNIYLSMSTYTYIYLYICLMSVYLCLSFYYLSSCLFVKSAFEGQGSHPVVPEFVCDERVRCAAMHLKVSASIQPSCSSCFISWRDLGQTILFFYASFQNNVCARDSGHLHS